MIDRLKAWLTQKPDDDAAIAAAMQKLRDAAVQLGASSFAAGERSAQERVKAIARLAHAARFPELALALAADDFLTVETAAEALAAEAERAALALSQPAELPPFEDGRAPTFH